MRFRRWIPLALLVAMSVAAGASAQGKQPKSPAAPDAHPAKPAKKGKSAQAARPAAAQASTQAAAESDTSPLKDLPVIEKTLHNGLRLVLSPDHTIPTVAIAVYYNVGSRNEVRGRAGFAHLFEHMMFQGSKNVGKMEHFKLIVDHGGEANASTSEDRTNYFETLPSNDLALGLWLEADRMKSLAVTKKNFENQRMTVEEEMRQRVDNQPYGKSMIRINELAYGDYWPYAHPTIGNKQDLDNAPMSAVKAFFKKYYAPNNAVLAIVGDIDPAHAIQLVEKYFGDIEPSKIPPYNPPNLQPQTAERKDEMVDPLAELPAFHIAYHIPPSHTPDHYALELLATILGDGESSRLYQKLVKQKEILQEIDVSTDDRRGPDLFSFFGIVAAGHTGAEARKVIYGELSDIAKHGVTDKELQKAKNRIRAAFIFGLQTNLHRAMQLAHYELYWGDAKLLRTDLNNYLAVTKDDIERVAQKYFDPTNRTVLDVVPAKKQGAKQ